MSYDLASSAGMADAILALGEQTQGQQDQLAKVLVSLSQMEPKARAEWVQSLMPPNSQD